MDDADRVDATVERLELAAVQAVNSRPIRPGGTFVWRGWVWTCTAVAAADLLAHRVGW